MKTNKGAHDAAAGHSPKMIDASTSESVIFIAM